MNILYDSATCDLIGNGGTSRYPVELYKNVGNYTNIKVGCCITSNQYMLDLGYPNFNCFGLSNVPSNYIQQVNFNYTKQLLKTGKYDIYHPTDNNTLLLNDVPNNTKVVFTVHDCLPEVYNMSPLYFAPGTFEMKKEMIERADGIICVSNQTKSDLYKYYNIKDNQKVITIYNGRPNNKYDNLPRLLNFDYILYVGGREVGNITHKRFLTLIKEFAILHKSLPDIKLICVGADFSKDECTAIQNAGLTFDNILTTSANDKQLASLYQYAYAFVASAEYEGFGLTPMEAMVYNKNVFINETNPAFKEIYGNSVNLFNIDKEGDFANKILHNIDNDLTNEQQIILNKYSWDKCGKETVEFYESLL